MERSVYSGARAIEPLRGPCVQPEKRRFAVWEGTEPMTDKDEKAKAAKDQKEFDAANKKAQEGLSPEAREEYNRISPDSPFGQVETREDTDFYQRQRDADPDGMTASEREQHQKAAPGALKQESPAGEKLGDPETEQPQPTSQSKP